MKATYNHTRHGTGHRNMLLSITVGLCLLITAVVFTELHSLERRNLIEKFRYLADRRAEACTDVLNHRSLAVDSLQGLYTCSVDVDREEFQKFTESSTVYSAHPLAIQWVPHVREQARHAFELRARREGIENFQFIQRNGAGTLVAALERSEYLPVYYVAPQGRNVEALGYDLASDTPWSQALRHAVETGQETGVTGLHLPGQNEDVKTVTLIKPIYKSHSLKFSVEHRRMNLSGFIVAIFDLQALLESALKPFEDTNIQVELLDATDQEHIQQLCLVPDHMNNVGPVNSQQPGTTGLVRDTVLPFHDKTWRIRCSAGPDFLATPGSWNPMIALLVGLIATAATGFHLRTYLMRYEKVQQLVEERTKALNESRVELKEHNDFLNHILASLAHPLYVIDANDFTIVLSNRGHRANNTQPVYCYTALHGLSQPCDDDVMTCPVLAIKATKKPCIVQRIRPDTDGQERFYEVHAYPVLDANGNISQVIEYHVDITNRKQAETLQRERTEELAAIYDNAPLVMMLVDEDRRVRKVNRYALIFGGRSEDEMIGKRGGSALDCLHALDNPAGCGSGPACAECTIRHTIADTLETGQSHSQVEAQMPFRMDGQNHDLTLLLSTTRVRIQNEWMALVSILDITGRKKAEQQVKDQLVFTETLLNTLPNPVYYKDPEGRYLGVNNAFTEFIGMPESKIFGKTVFDLAPTELAQKHRQQDQLLFQSPGTQHYEWQVRNSEGQLREVMFDKATFMDTAGNVAGLIGVMSDVTDHKQTEAKLRNQKDLLSHMLSNIPASVFWKDTDGVYRGCNEAFAHWAGVASPEAIIGKTDEDLLWKDQAQTQRHSDLEVMETAKPQLNREAQQSQADGSQITVLTSKVPLMDTEGKVVGMLGICSDITERKRDQEEIAILARFPSENPYPVLRILCNGTLIYANAASRPLLEFFQIEIGDVLPPQWIHTVKEVFRNNTIITQELDCNNKTYSLTLAPVIEGHYINVYALDITVRKLAEQHQAALMEELESINAELKDFAYVVSHDLKAPLRGIRTLADWLVEDLTEQLGQENREQLGLIANRADRMQSLIDGILEYSRIARNREDYKPVDLQNLVSEIIDSLSPPEHIYLEVIDKLPTVQAEPTRMTQLFQNLLSNAIKYIDKDNGHVRIGCTDKDEYWEFFVTDNGPGIEERHFERIFKLFQTLCPRNKSDSTGVGLTVVKKIVELHEGTIWVESQVGEGTTFYFTLPKSKLGTTNANSKTRVAC